MKNKMKKSLIAALAGCIILGTGSTYLASSGSLTWSATKKKVYAAYNHGVPVSVLQIKFNYTEVHQDTGHVEEDVYWSTATGGCTAVSATKLADTGYNFTKVLLSNYIDGKADTVNKNLPIS